MKINILNIRRKLPESVRKPLRWLFHKWNIKLEDEMVEDLMDYFSLDRKTIIYLLKSSGRLSADLWRCLNPKTKEEIESFYKEAPFYVFNLIFWHATRGQRELRSEFISLARGKVLDYGGAVGDMCMKSADKKLETDYADLPGRMYNFAKWLFYKKGYNIPMIDLSRDKILKKYDTIFCIDVIEHVVNPKELLKDLAGYLSDGGQLIITNLKPVISKEAPMHLELKFDPEDYLTSLRMVKTNKPFLWIKK